MLVEAVARRVFPRRLLLEDALLRLFFGRKATLKAGWRGMTLKVSEFDGGVSECERVRE